MLVGSQKVWKSYRDTLQWMKGVDGCTDATLKDERRKDKEETQIMRRDAGTRPRASSPAGRALRSMTSVDDILY